MKTKKAVDNLTRAFSITLALMTLLASCGEGGNANAETTDPEVTGSGSVENTTAGPGEVSSLPEKFDLEKL